MKHAIRDRRGNYETEKTVKGFEKSAKRVTMPKRNSKYRSIVKVYQLT